MKCKIYFHLKRGLWTTEAAVQFFFSLAQVRCFWQCFCFRSGLVALFPEDVWAWWLLMHWLQLRFTACEALPSVWIGFAWQYSQACGHPCVHIFLSQFLPSVNLAFNMLWYSTPWTATPFSNDPLWLTLFVEGVNYHLWTIAKSAVFPIIVVSKNKRYPECILYGWSIIETQM